MNFIRLTKRDDLPKSKEIMKMCIRDSRRIDLNDKEAIDSLMPYSEQLPDTCRRKENE